MVIRLKALDRKVLRDLGRLWAQAVAIALVLACGVAIQILSTGAYRSLEETRAAYYDRFYFGDVFASLKRAPVALKTEIAAISGVAAVQLRVRDSVVLDIEGMREPGTGMALSVPDYHPAVVNRTFLRAGRLPEPGKADEVAINETFAKAHGFTAGSRFGAIINGRKRTLTVTGIALSPEFIYAMGPGDMVPDERRFGILFFSERTLSGLLDLEGAFNDVSLRLLKGADEQVVIDRLDLILKPYGGAGAYGRKDQMSHAFLDAELTQLKIMSQTIPPVFLLVSAFLINMILSRLIALEREQIGLFKAIGYSNRAVAMHYIKLVIAISFVGILIGFGFGTWLGRGLFRLYGDFYHFPFLIFRTHVDIYLIAAGISLAAAVAGGIRAVWGAVRLPPAVAMRPPSPTVYRKLLSERLGLLKPFSRLTVMGLRHLIRHPLRSGMTALGTAFAVGLLAVSMVFNDVTAYLIDWVYYQSERQNAAVAFTSDAGPDALQAVARLPGVMKAEPGRSALATLRFGHRQRRLSIAGKVPDATLSRVLDDKGRPVVIADAGLTLTERVANILGARPGDMIQVEFMQGKRRQALVPVSMIVPSYLGLSVYMNMDALNRLTGEGPRIDSAAMVVDGLETDALYAAIKETPKIASVTLLDLSRQKFNDTINENISIMTTIYVILSVIIAFGVVYNAARIQLSERARELASLRVLGFTEGEVFSVLVAELGTIAVIAQPIGWLIGTGIAYMVISGFDSDLYRLPFVIQKDTFAIASGVTLAAVAASGLIIWRRVARLDLIRVLKTRE